VSGRNTHQQTSALQCSTFPCSPRTPSLSLNCQPARQPSLHPTRPLPTHRLPTIQPLSKGLGHADGAVQSLGDCIHHRV
jgi:hypothetical protein